MVNETRKDSLEKLTFFIKNGLNNYSSQRNFDFGPDKRSNVSNLSPYIRKRIIHEIEVLQECLKFNKYENIEKFVQEVFWRTYWKGWLEGRSEIWDQYQKSSLELKQLYSQGVRKKNYQNALTGNTGIDCFDFWVNELIDFGYLHNHARMWFASIWIHTLNLPWQLGADFFLRNLLDADPASNTLSWRWVAGLHTQGKNYLASENNINKFTENRFKKKKNLSSKPLQFDYKIYDFKLNEFKENSKTPENSVFLINLNHLVYKDEVFNKFSNNKVCFVESLIHGETSELVKSFNKKAINDYSKTLEAKNININFYQNFSDFNIYLKKNNYKEIYTFYPGVGRQKDILNYFITQNNYKLTYEYDDFDKMCWPNASSGFFKFKKKIPFFLNEILKN